MPEEKTSTQKKTVFTISFPTPHNRRGCSGKMMVSWGFNDWAAETIATKYNVKVARKNSQTSAHCYYDRPLFELTIPEHFDSTVFLKKLQKLYNIFVYW